MDGGAIGDGIVEGAKATSWFLLGLLAFRVVQWLCNFLAGRLDHRQEVLDAQQKLVDDRMANRLRNLERQVAVLDQVTTKLIAIVREIEPTHPGLAEVHALLAINLKRGVPIDPDIPADMQNILRGLDDVE